MVLTQEQRNNTLLKQLSVMGAYIWVHSVEHVLPLYQLGVGAKQLRFYVAPEQFAFFIGEGWVEVKGTSTYYILSDLGRRQVEIYAMD